MSTPRDIMTAKHTARLARLPANSGHARVLRAKLGISPVVDAPPALEPASAPKKEATKKKGRWR